MSKLTLHLEGDSIEELRIAAASALDMRLNSTGPGMVIEPRFGDHVTGNGEDEVADPDEVTTALGIDEPAKGKGKPAIRRKIAHPPAPANLKPPVKPKKPTKKPAKKVMESRFIKPAPVEPDGRIADEAIKAAFNRYVNEFGPEHVLVDGPAILRRICGDGVEKISQVPRDKLGRVIAAVDAAIMTNEFKREVLTSAPEANI